MALEEAEPLLEVQRVPLQALTNSVAPLDSTPLATQIGRLLKDLQDKQEQVWLITERCWGG